MSSWHEGPLAGLDFETTGTDPEQARIVTACAAMDLPGEEPHVVTWLADPGVPIPDEAVAVHGITTDRARADGVPEQRATAEILTALGGSFGAMPLVIYNAPYDATLLDRAARRHGLDASDALDRDFIDPLVLDKALDKYRRGSRRLPDVCRHYGIALDNAHDATADTLAAIALARELGRRYPQIARMGWQQLREFQAAAKAEQSASLQEYLRRQGSREFVDPSWPVIPWKEPEPAVTFESARQKLILAALGSASLDYEASSGGDAAAFAGELLVRCARDLVAAADRDAA